MSTCRKRCSLKEDHGAALATYWQCRRRSHPVQHMGGVCAMCLTEQLSTITRSCVESKSRRRPPQSTDLLPPSIGLPVRSAGTHAQSMDSEGNHDVIKSKQARMCARQCENDDDGMQEMSARNSSAGSEQSIASLIERDIDEGRQRYSDATASWSKELARPESSNDGHTPCAKKQLVRSRSYSTNSHVSSKQSTPASYGKSNSGTVLPNSEEARKLRRCNTTRAEIRGSSGDSVPLLAKSKSMGSNCNVRVNMAPPLRSPAIHHHAWSLPKFWHKKIQAERRHSADASASRDLSSSLVVQADDSATLIKMSRSCSMRAGGGRENFKSICDQIRCMGIIKWLTSSSFNLLRRSPSGKPTSTGAGSTTSVRTGSAHACRPEPLIFSNLRGDGHKAAEARPASTEGALQMQGCAAAESNITDEGAAAIRTPTLYSGNNTCSMILRSMQPTHQEDCQSIAALVSMDAHLIHHLV